MRIYLKDIINRVFSIHKKKYKLINKKISNSVMIKLLLEYLLYHQSNKINAQNSFKKLFMASSKILRLFNNLMVVKSSLIKVDSKIQNLKPDWDQDF